MGCQDNSTVVTTDINKSPIKVFKKALACNAFIVYSEKSKIAMVLDAFSADPEFIDFIEKNRLNVKYVAVTHAHPDHTSGAGTFLAKYPNSKFYAPLKEKEYWSSEVLKTVFKNYSPGFPDDFVYNPENWYSEGFVFDFGDFELSAFECPGHTPGHTMLISLPEKVIFSGDMLHADGYAVTFVPGGSEKALYESLEKCKAAFIDDWFIYPGHHENTTFGVAIKQQKTKF